MVLTAVVLTPNTPAGSTTAEIFLWDGANPNAATDDTGDNVEVTFSQLPI